MKILERLNALLRSLTSGPGPEDDGEPPTLEAEDVGPLVPLTFEAAKDTLTIRLHISKPATLVSPIPDLEMSLALDLPGQFRLLQAAEMEAWGMDEDELAWTAHANLSEKLDQIRVFLEETDGFSLITLKEADYAAAYAADFENHCATWIGRMGAMVSFPATGTVLICPLREAASFNKAFTQIAEKTNKLYREGPSSLSNSLYWYHGRRFEPFPKTLEGQTLSYAIPYRLLAYLKTPLAHPSRHSDVKDALLEGTWEGFFEYGQGYKVPTLGRRVGFQTSLQARTGQLEGQCMDEGNPVSVGIWGFVDGEVISFIKHTPTQDIHFTGFYDKQDQSFAGTWVLEEDDQNVFSGTWAMIRV